MRSLYSSAVRVAAATMLILLGSTVTAAAATQQSSAGSLDTVAQSYATSKPLQNGLIVQLDTKNKKAITTVGYKDSKKIFGVVVSPNDTAVSLSGGADGQSAYVVTSGEYSVLVSTQNGSIKPGDYISTSALDGIGMKVDSKQDSVLGRATAGFDGRDGALSSMTLKQSDGKDLKVSIGSVKVNLRVEPNKQKETDNNGVPSIVQTLAVSLVGKPISVGQLYASAAILITGLGVVASLLFSGIQTGMTAIGRNPLARKSIMRNLTQVIITGFLILIGCLIAVYLVLKI